MAVTRDTFKYLGTSAGGAASLSTTYTCAGNVVVVHVFYSNASTEAGCTYNGVAMVHVGTALGAGNFNTNTYILVNPSTSAGVTVTATRSGVTTSIMAGWIESFSNAGTTQPDSFTAVNSSAAGNSASISGTISIVKTGSYISAGAFNQGNYTSAVGSGVTPILSTNPDLASALLDSNGTVSAGSNSFGYTGAGLAPNGIFAIAIAPPATAVNSGFFFAVDR